MSTTEWDPAVRQAAAKEVTYYTADRVELTVGLWCWDNNLDAVQVTEIAAQVYGSPEGCGHGDYVYHAAGCEVAWHDTKDKDGRRGSYDAGPFGRLATRFDSITAADAVAQGAHSLAEVRAMQAAGTWQR
jgi:hypothetical protein